MTRAEDVDKQLEALYDQVPKIQCKGLCADSCGVVEGGIRERVRLARAGVKLPPFEEHKDQASRHRASTGKPYQCPALVDGACSVYEVRPMVCRIWGVMEGQVCPYGCADGVRILPLEEHLALLDAADKAGTGQEPFTAEILIKELKRRPGLRAKMLARIWQYTPTQ